MVSPILTVEQAISLIIEDLKTAKELLVNDPMHLGTSPSKVLAPLPSGSYASYHIAEWHNRRFSFNYYASVATLARAYLWKNDRESALKEARELIADQKTKFPWVENSNLSTIGSSVAGANNQDATFATEHVFAMNIKSIKNYMAGLCYFGESSPSGCLLAPYAYLSYADVFETSTDYRSQYLAFSYGGMRYCNKFYQYENVYSFFKERVPLIRVSEMYYIIAECATDLDEARQALDAVRSHRGLTSMPLSSNITRSELDNEILKEYRKEFIGEGQLWFYYKRKCMDLVNEGWMYNIYTFTDMDRYTFDRPDDEDGNRK